MNCNALVANDAIGWHAWCKAHTPVWIGPDREFIWQARMDKAHHLGGGEPEVAPDWVRGPGR